MTSRAPAEVFCMQSFVAEEMIERGWTTEDVAARMNTKQGAALDLFYLNIIMCVPDEQLLIEDDFFEGLGRAFDVSPTFFKNLHETWIKYPNRRVAFDAPDELFGPPSRRAIAACVP